MLTTLNSLAERLPHSLIVPLVREHLWTSAQALTYIRRMSKVKNRAVALTTMLASELVEPSEWGIVREEALRAAYEFKDSTLLLRLAALCEQGHRVEICRSIWRDLIRSTSWREVDEVRCVVSQLEKIDVIPSLILEMLAFATVPSNESRQNIEKLQLLSALAKHIPKDQQLPCLQAGRKIMAAISHSYYGEDAAGRVAFAELRYHCGDRNVRVGDLRLRSVHNLQHRAELQIRAALLPGNAASLQKDAMDSLIHIKQKMDCIAAICKLAPLFGDSAAEMLWQHALATAQSLDRATERANYCARLCEVVPRESSVATQAKTVALQAVNTIRDKEDRNIALSEVAIRIGSHSLWSEFGDPVKAAQQIASTETRSRQLCRLAGCFPVERRREILFAAIAALNELSDFDAQAVALVSTASLLTENRREQVIMNCVELLDKAIASHPQTCVEVIEKALAIGLDKAKVRILSRISRSLADHGLRARALTAVARHLSQPEVAKAVSDAYSAIKRMGKTVERRAEAGGIFAALKEILPLLSIGQLQDSLVEITRIKWRYEYITNAEALGKAKWLRCLAPALSHYPQLWDTAVEIAVALEDSSHYYDDGEWYFHYKEHALYKLVYYAPSERLSRARELGESCRPTSDVDSNDTWYQLMLVSLASREDRAARAQLLKKLLYSIRLIRGEAKVFDVGTAKYLCEQILNDEVSKSSISRLILNVYCWTVPSAREEIFEMIQASFPEAISAIRSWLQERDRRQQSGANVTDFTLEQLMKGERAKLLEHVKTLIEPVSARFGEDGVWAIRGVISENSSWWP